MEFFAIIAGILIGIFTGLIPGIHVNLICAILLSLVATATYDPSIIIAFIASLAVTHTFFDVLPGLFLGIPGDSTFALLPGHRLVKKGYGILAIKLSAIGSFFGLAIGLFFIVALMYFDTLTGIIDNKLPEYLFWILIAISGILILSEQNRLSALFVFLASGIFGMLVETSPMVPPRGAAIGSLFPALTGLFAISGLLWSLYTLEIQKNQIKIENQTIDYTETTMPSLRGGIAGFLVGILPGLGGANAATFLLLIENWLGKQKDRNHEDRSYLVTTSALNTSETMIAIVTIYLIGKSRSGASVAISSVLNDTMTVGNLQTILIAMILAGGLSILLLWKIGPVVARKIHQYDYPALNWSLLVFLLSLVALYLGVGGIAILLSAAIIGLMPFVLNVRKGQLMGYFLVPTIIYYSGKGRIIYDSLEITQRYAPTQIFDNQFIFIGLIISIVIAIFGYRYISNQGIQNKQHHLYAEKTMNLLFVGVIISLIYIIFSSKY